MSGHVGNFVLTLLRHIDRRLDNVAGDMHDIKLRMSMVKDHLGTIIVSMAGLNHRMDRFDKQLTRVENRLELADQH